MTAMNRIGFHRFVRGIRNVARLYYSYFYGYALTVTHALQVEPNCHQSVADMHIRTADEKLNNVETCRYCQG